MLELVRQTRYYPLSVNIFFKTVSAVALLVLASGSIGAGLAQPPAGQGRAQGAAAAPPPPPAAQPGHPMGKLVIWGDVVNFNAPGTPNQCVGQTRYKRGERIGFRMTAVDGGSGDVENTAVVVAHVIVGGKTIDVPMRWRGVGNFPADQYLRAPREMWTGGWAVPADAPIGRISYTVTATDRFGRTASFTPFAAIPSQLAIVE
jgi:hypothetical protein